MAAGRAIFPVGGAKSLLCACCPESWRNGVGLRCWGTFFGPFFLPPRPGEVCVMSRNSVGEFCDLMGLKSPKLAYTAIFPPLAHFQLKIFNFSFCEEAQNKN